MTSATATPIQTKPAVDDGAPADADFAGWYCVRTKPFQCPAKGCTFVAHYMTAVHLIVVWPEPDDRMMLTYARDARDLGREPKIVEYQPDFGPCIPYDAWAAAGNPIHAHAPAPEGWDNTWKPL